MDDPQKICQLIKKCRVSRRVGHVRTQAPGTCPSVRRVVGAVGRRCVFDVCLSTISATQAPCGMLIFCWRELHLNFTTMCRGVRVELYINYCTIVAYKQAELKLTTIIKQRPNVRSAQNQHSPRGGSLGAKKAATCAQFP